MRRMAGGPMWVVFAVAALVAGPAAAAGPTAALKSVEQVLADYVRASGGPALETVKAETWKGRLRRIAEGQVPFEVAAEMPGRWCYLQRFAWGDRVRYASDGLSAWVQDARGVREMDARQRRDLTLLLDPRAPLRLRELYPELRRQGREELDGRQAEVLAARAADGGTAELSFDLESGHLLRIDDIRLADHRSVDGVVRPFRITLDRDGLLMQITAIQHAGDAADSLFERPVCALGPQEPLFFRHRRQVSVSAAAMDACVGRYKVGELGLVLELSRQGEHLMMGVAGTNSKVEVLPMSDTVFFREFEDYELRFHVDGGTARRMDFVVRERVIPAERVD